MYSNEELKKFLKHLELASKIVNKWPSWKRGYLETSSNPYNKTPRKEIKKTISDK